MRSSVFFVFLFCAARIFSIQIDDEKDYAILSEFLKRGFSEEEDYGYVLEGIKPISVRNFQARDSFLVPNHLDWEFLVSEAIPIWNRLCNKGKQYVFKITYFPDAESIAPGFELQFINVSRLTAVIEENINIFRCVLGPSVNAEQLAKRIAFSDQPLDDVLKNDQTLVGIVLGFGVYNSLIGGKMDMLASRVLVRDTAPFIPQHRFFQDSNFFLPESMYRLYYLEFAGGDDRCFREREAKIQLGQDSSELEEELKEFIIKEEDLPDTLLKENPRFVFAAYKGEKSNQALFARLIKAQKWIQELVKKENFFETVLEKIDGRKPKITCVKPSSPLKLFKNREKEWTQLINSVAKRFDMENQRTSLIDAFCHPTESTRKRPWALGVTQATLQGLLRARMNLAQADKKFHMLPSKQGVKEIVKGLLYSEILKVGSGIELLSDYDHVRVGYTIEDDAGSILFANFDIWLHLQKTIPGFIHGVQGMRIGEKRTLYIHPGLAYGALSTLPPCSSLTIKVQLLAIDEQSITKKSILPPRALDLSWVNDPNFYENIQASLQQIPKYIGSFYRDWLDKRSELHMSLLTARLRKNLQKNDIAAKDQDSD